MKDLQDDEAIPDELAQLLQGEQPGGLGGDGGRGRGAMYIAAAVSRRRDGVPEHGEPARGRGWGRHPVLLQGRIN